MDKISFQLWRQDVAKSLVFQWCLLGLVCAFSGFAGFDAMVSVLVSGAAIAVPNTALGAWMGIRLWLGKASAAGVFIGSALKTLVSVVLLCAAFAALQEFGWVWQGFLAGLMSMVLSPVVFGIASSQRA